MILNRNDNPYMQEALALAYEAGAADEVPVGAVVVYNKKIIGRGRNAMRQTFDPTAHAEIMALREAAMALEEIRLTECDLYVTLEPCPMCAQAIAFARIRRLYFGAYDPKGGGVDHGPRIFSQSTCHHKPEVFGGGMETQCQAVLKDFFKSKR